MKRLLVVAVAAGSLLIPAAVSARTWYVNEEGTGDAPTIEAAMDSAAYGDTVLVGPGTYQHCQLQIPDGVTLTSESGPATTTLVNATVGFGATGYESGTLHGFTFEGTDWNEVVACYGAEGFKITGNVFVGNEHSAVICELSEGQVRGNTMVGNGDWAIWILSYSNVEVQGNLCVRNGVGIMASESMGVPQCNDCWSNGVDFDGVPGTEFGNFSADPLFCDEQAGDLTLHANSPCLLGNHPDGFDCGLIGALGQGCNGPYTSVEEEEPTDSWTTIKALFR